MFVVKAHRQVFLTSQPTGGPTRAARPSPSGHLHTCPPTPPTTSGAPDRSWGIRASTKAWKKTSQRQTTSGTERRHSSATPPPREVLTQQPASTRQPIQPRASSSPHDTSRDSRREMLHLPGFWSPLRAFTRHEHLVPFFFFSVPFFSVSISTFQSNRNAVAAHTYLAGGDGIRNGTHNTFSFFF